MSSCHGGIENSELECGIENSELEFSELRVLEKVIALHLVPKQYFFAKNIIKGWYLAVLALFSNKPTVHTPLHLAVDDKDSSEIMPEISPDLRIHKHK